MPLMVDLTLSVPKIEIPDPKRTAFLILRHEPKKALPKIERVLPHWAQPKALSPLPRRAKSRREQFDASAT
jgi:hypothetical protein